MKSTKALLSLDIKEIPLFKKGKVRNVYDLGDKLLFVVSDRISAFDVIMPNGIPNKGKVLNMISSFCHAPQLSCSILPCPLPLQQIFLQEYSLLLPRTLQPSVV